MENKYSKPGYDGRLKYYEHLKSYWDRLADATFNDDYDLKYKILRGYFSRTQAFIKEPEEIKKKFDKVLALIRGLYNFSTNNQSYIIQKITDLLQLVEDDLFMATKDMLVSTKDENEDDFDMEEFMRQSD